MIEDQPLEAAAWPSPARTWTLEPDASLQLLGKVATGRVSFACEGGASVVAAARHVIVSGELVIGYQHTPALAETAGRQVSYTAGRDAGDDGCSWGVRVSGIARPFEHAGLAETLRSAAPSLCHGVDRLLRVVDATVTGQLVPSAEGKAS